MMVGIILERSVGRGNIVQDLALESVIQLIFQDNEVNPGNLPSSGAANPVFVATANFGADVQGNPNNSINTSADVLGIVIELLPGLGFSDVQNALSDGTLRLGLPHVRGIGGSGDSFVNNPASPVPVPIAFWLFGTGIISLRGFRRTIK